MVYGYILEVDPIGFITAVDMRSKRIKEVTNASKDFGLSIQMSPIAILVKWENLGKGTFEVVENQEFSHHQSSELQEYIHPLLYT